MAAIVYPTEPTALDYLVSPWTAPDGSQWLYDAKGRWEPYVAAVTVDPDTVIVASPVNDDMIQRVGGSWVTRTLAQIKTALGLGTAAYVNTGTGNGDAILGDDFRLIDDRTPTEHNHGAINNAGEIGTTANLPIFTGVQGQLNAISSLSTARTNLGATTVGGSLFTLANPDAITFPLINADNTVTALSNTAFRTALGVGTGDRPTFNGIICGTGFNVAASNGTAVLVNPSLTGTTTCGGWFQLKAGSATEGLYFGSGHLIRWGSSSTNTSAAGDVGVGRNAAGVAEINSGTSGAFRDLKLRNLVTTDYLEGAEMTAPAAPAANSYRIFAEDNGGGKTRLMVVFATGAAQQIAIEP